MFALVFVVVLLLTWHSAGKKNQAE